MSSGEPVEVVDYDPEWPCEFERFRERIVTSLGDVALRVEHVGSTAVPGLVAKPIVDVDVVVRRDDVDHAVERLESIGYRPHQHRLDIPDRHAVAWPLGERRHHVYVVPSDSAELARHLRLRDALRADPDLAREYGELKRDLARLYRNDRVRYGEEKSAFVERVLGRFAR